MISLPKETYEVYLETDGSAPTTAQFSVEAYCEIGDTQEAIALGNLWAYLKDVERIWMTGDEVYESMFTRLWGSAVAKGVIDDSPRRFWAYYPPDPGRDDPGWDEPLERDIEQLLHDIHTALIERIYEVEDNAEDGAD